MRSTKLQSSMLAVGLLSAVNALGIVQPALAQSRAQLREERRDVRQTRERVRDQRQDVREADSARERREEQAALARKQQKLRQEQAELQRAQQQRLQQQRVQQRRDYNGRYNYNRNGFNTRSDFRTVEGIVVNDLSGNGFLLRTGGGQQLRVQVPGGEPNRISRGDRVRVYGFFNNGAFRAQNLTVLRNR